MLIRSKADFKEKMSCLTKKESQKLNEVTTLTIQLMEKYGVHIINLDIATFGDFWVCAIKIQLPYN